MKPQVNLLPKYEKYSNLAYIIFIILLVLLIVLSGVLTYFLIKERSTLEEKKAEISRLSDEKSILLAQISSAEETETTSIVDAVDFAKSQAVPVSKLVDELVELLPENSYLVNYRYDYESVTIDTHFETMTDVAEYMELLTNSHYLLDAKVEYIDTQEVEETEDQEKTEEESEYPILPRYQTTYSMDVNQQELMKEEEDE